MTTTVTLSAAYGSGGSVVGPLLAERLAVPFHDRAIPAQVAEDLDLDLDTVLVHDGRAEHGLSRLFAAVAWLPNTTLGGMEGFLPGSERMDKAVVAERTAEVLRHIAAEQGGVILGRAAAVVLADDPHVLHVRIDGPPEARIRQAMTLRNIDEPTARERQQDNDAARQAYVEQLYGRDPRDLTLYDLMLDSTAVPFDACVDIIERAARSLRRS